jgi:hypothetical protein
VNGLPESGSSALRRHPRLFGTLVGLAVFALVAKWALWSGFLAVVGFSGCFIDCSEPDPLLGAVWALFALAFLALPVITGVLVARAISGSSRSVMALKMLALLLALLLCMVVLYRPSLMTWPGI